MNRIFTYLALFATLFVAATLVLGMSLGDVRDPADRTTQRWATVHRLSGIAAGLAVVFVDSIAVTYFIGTSRWCREVVDTYRLDRSLAVRSAALKRRTFPVAVISMLTVVGIVALGGAADPAASLQLEPLGGLTWATLHLYGAMLGLAVIIACFVIARNNIEANHELIDEIVAKVQRVRRERGLET